MQWAMPLYCIGFKLARVSIAFVPYMLVSVTHRPHGSSSRVESQTSIDARRKHAPRNRHGNQTMIWSCAKRGALRPLDWQRGWGVAKRPPSKPAGYAFFTLITSNFTRARRYTIWARGEAGKDAGLLLVLGGRNPFWPPFVRRNRTPRESTPDVRARPPF